MGRFLIPTRGEALPLTPAAKLSKYWHSALSLGVSFSKSRLEVKAYAHHGARVQDRNAAQDTLELYGGMGGSK